MLNQIKMYENFIIGGLLIVASVVIYFYINGYKSKISRLETKLTKSQLELANTKLENERYKNSIEIRNKEIKAMEVDKKAMLAEKRRWENLPPEIRYVKIPTEVKVESNECKDIKSALDAVKLINPNIL